MTTPINGGSRTPSTASPEEQQKFFDDVRQTFESLPRFIAKKFNDRISSAYRLKGFAGAQEKFSDIIRHDLRLVELTHQVYAIAPGELPGYLFGGLASDDAYGAVRSMTFRFNALVDGDESDAALLAQDLAEFLCDEVEYLNRTLRDESAPELLGVLYSMAAGIAEHFKADPPEWSRFTGKKLTPEQLKIAISRMISVRFWSRHFRTFTRRWREHLYITVGDVRRQRSVICSPQWVQHWMASRKRGREIMAETNIEDEETGETLPLLAAVDASVSNNERRRAEMLTRVKGLEELAALDRMSQDSDYVALFFTWTAPQQYHAWLETGRRNRKWNGASPRETQHYFTRTFKNFSTALTRRDIHIFGMHITESHHDGTPHWHGILFVRREQESTLRDVFEMYANAENCSANRAGKPPEQSPQSQIMIKPVDRRTGSPTAYITKHICRNLEGCAPGGRDKETGSPWTELARHSAAWASLWGIKQFQFTGGPPVSVWRELRKLSDQKQADSVNPVFGELHRAAGAGDWAEYTRLQGGLPTARKNLTMRTWYQAASEPDECGQYTAIIKGVYLPGTNKAPVVTRTRKWKVKAPRQNAKAGSLRINRKPSLTPWTRINNCTMRRKQPVDHPPDFHLKIPIQLELDFGETKKVSVSEK
ncbi:replication endonuclease [Salmonella enterica]|uniref:Replication endonuclease n=2 Tax=Salmonella enterica TaxID=28901 RepID=A0A2T6WZS6_SALET|nr:replication endonuclease [Salmonella enterica]EDQ9944965.1 replication endonuclease [Salmonella enterica subsp. enterica serovar Gaminara]EAX3090377.1 replication endonuclease [Salmonella enterica]EAY8178179.1 replication endonuclease [Salmonella enterica]EBA3629494.1 replication endonuclease [Salmonella enterica]EBP9213603.1 replication endonuclease [Salmonella enterica]